MFYFFIELETCSIDSMAVFLGENEREGNRRENVMTQADSRRETKHGH